MTVPLSVRLSLRVSVCLPAYRCAQFTQLVLSVPLSIWIRAAHSNSNSTHYMLCLSNTGNGLMQRRPMIVTSCTLHGVLKKRLKFIR